MQQSFICYADKSSRLCSRDKWRFSSISPLVGCSASLSLSSSFCHRRQSPSSWCDIGSWHQTRHVASPSQNHWDCFDPDDCLLEFVIGVHHQMVVDLVVVAVVVHDDADDDDNFWDENWRHWKILATGQTFLVSATMVRLAQGRALAVSIDCATIIGTAAMEKGPMCNTVCRHTCLVLCNFPWQVMMIRRRGVERMPWNIWPIVVPCVVPSV